jgi:8-oxo-dGTP pyrophosphatase MutT (NUDIX family)
MLHVHIHNKRFRDAEFKEEEHPRGEGGKFAKAQHFTKGTEAPPHVNNIPLKSYNEPDVWNSVGGQNREIDEPPGATTSSGLIMQEKDGRVWIVKPTNAYGGYEYTFPKGRVEKGMHPQANAIKETFEESGLKGKIIKHAGDYGGTTGTTRYYMAEREGGHPHDYHWESEGVSLVHPKELLKYLNMPRDRKIVADLFGIKE